MIRTETQLQDQRWTDILAPKKEDLTALSAETGIPLRPLLSCLDPEHLPKYEVLDTESIIFVILRVVDTAYKSNADSIEKLTTKIALFLTPRGLFTIHRLDPDFLKELRERVVASPGKTDIREFMRQLIMGSLMSYDAPLTLIEKKIDTFEDNLIKGHRTGRLLKDGFLLKRRLSAYRKILKFTIDVFTRVAAHPVFAWKDMQDSKERADRLLFYADDDLENVTTLLNLHIALASQKTNEASFRTNEIMRVLTVVSILFLPLNFIAGIYGMNFETMPELHWEHGYQITIGVMALVALSIFLWMRHRGWLSTPEKD
ncbi:MAG: magnesium and cobalt transport protein [Bdellovibrionaceae bacterium]|nr:magnesium and cobalt transport protein [Pseudobdellovibrionaceae bacterium]